MEPQWLMSTWILTENFRKLLLKHGKSNQEIAKEINDFCSSWFLLEAMIGWLSVGYLER
jgi:hypothetical protein